MLQYIVSLEKLVEEAEQIQNDLDVTCSDDPEEAILRGNDMSVYVSRTAKMLADAKYHLNAAMKSEALKMLQDVAKQTPFATAKTVNALTDSLCKNERFAVDWIERLNRAATHQLDWLRTVVSKAKADQYASRSVNG